MTEVCIALLQAGGSSLKTDVLRFSAITFVFIMVISLGAFYIFRGLRKANDGGIKAQLDADFEKTREALLLAATAKKQRHDSDESARRELAADAKERELLRENVDIGRVLGLVDPLSGLEMMVDMELIVDPYT
ncbi:MAG: hypothetical protein M3R04_01730, partial [bacterium]|nr:hypothetical protein [bacterium]